MTILGYPLDPMLVVLVLMFFVIAVSFWLSHRDADCEFDLFDLLTENGRVSKISVAFMLTLAVTTWLMIDLQLKGKMTEGYLTIYVGAWIAPLVARVVFGKTEVGKP